MSVYKLVKTKKPICFLYLMKNKLAKYQNEYIIFLVEVICLFFIIKNKRSIYFLALKSISLLVGKRIKSNDKTKILISLR